MTTAVASKLAELKAAEKAAKQAERTAHEQTLRDRAQREVDAEQRAADKIARKVKADAVEAEVRQHGPYVEIHCGTGKVVRIDLGASESVHRSYAVEAARRVCWTAADRFRQRVVASRNTLAVVPAVDFTAELAGSSAGLLPALTAGVATITDED
jgi:hypothetical protein